MSVATNVLFPFKTDNEVYGGDPEFQFKCINLLSEDYQNEFVIEFNPETSIIKLTLPYSGSG